MSRDFYQTVKSNANYLIPTKAGTKNLKASITSETKINNIKLTSEIYQ